MEKEKVLFLDIDGVLNTVSAELGFRFVKGKRESAYRTDTWCPASLYNLYRIVEKTKCKIVISSVWRHGRSLKQMKAWFRGCKLLQDAVIGKTPSLSDEDRNSVPRGHEIKTFLDMNRRWVGSWAILDDDSDMDGVHQGFFQTHGWDGITKDVADKVIRHLNRNGDIYYPRYESLIEEIRECFEDRDPEITEYLICEVINAAESQ